MKTFYYNLVEKNVYRIAEFHNGRIAEKWWMVGFFEQFSANFAWKLVSVPQVFQDNFWTRKIQSKFQLFIKNFKFIIFQQLFFSTEFPINNFTKPLHKNIIVSILFMCKKLLLFNEPYLFIDSSDNLIKFESFILKNLNFST